MRFPSVQFLQIQKESHDSSRETGHSQPRGTLGTSRYWSSSTHIGRNNSRPRRPRCPHLRQSPSHQHSWSLACSWQHLRQSPSHHRPSWAPIIIRTRHITVGATLIRTHHLGLAGLDPRACWHPANALIRFQWSLVDSLPLLASRRYIRLTIGCRDLLRGVDVAINGTSGRWCQHVARTRRMASPWIK